MTTIGHSLAGLSLALLVMPPRQSRRRAVLTALAFVGLANVPDLPISGWGHDAYHVSHSFFVTLVAVSLIVLILRRFAPFLELSWSVLLGGAAAWLSHMVLDSTYAHGNGLAVYWPFFDGRLAMPLPWFETLSMPVRSSANIRVLLVELLAFSMLVLLAGVTRGVWHGRYED